MCTGRRLEQPTKAASIAGSTETLDGFNDIEIPDIDEQKRRRSSKNLSIILVSIFIAWLILFMGVTIYQIRSYKRFVLRRDVKQILDEELETIEESKRREITKSVLKRLDGSSITMFVQPGFESLREIRAAEIEELANVETKVESFMKSKSFNLAERYEDLKFEKVNQNCYRKDFIRYNILNSGVDCRLVVKTSNIGAGSSENSGKCATTYYWIYNSPSKNETKIYSLGPYYGHHYVTVSESLFDKESKSGSLTLFGCQPPLDKYETSDEPKRIQSLIKVNAIITPNSYKSKDFKKFQIDLDKLAREEISKINKTIDELHYDRESVRDYTTLKEATSCIYSL
ncbi:conserved hypothetical protein [Theileria orientalis strain Shintoku]|uniref:Uncharacterized protein n=1 Tax=Theileria orientalis strain Shintoku TaxID=869250 RepID=J4C889_THEOR|nr:conserved hypothetical protein [Theileria orientalis strain Shintoku]BAM40368.1 conserved hypothetical protein [Theileria orientalis strain Shintoku]|eukprot:XP_009690669.1 conserved hypothetical protein [Theileria orientalis strain Shintoku]